MSQNDEVPLRLLIVEDQVVMAEALAEALVKRAKFQIVGIATNGAKALELVKQHQPDLVLIDTYLESGKADDSIQTLIAIKQYKPGTRVLFLSQFIQPMVQDEIMAAGADGYLSKGNRLDELVMAIKMVFRGKKIKDEPQIVSPGDQLSERERQIIVGICRGLSNREIGDSLGIAVATVRNSITAILAKLQCNNRIQAVAKARELGYLPPYEGCE
jgi:DNA-binding NarL/FixJ family response regulator